MSSTHPTTSHSSKASSSSSSSSSSASNSSSAEENGGEHLYEEQVDYDADTTDGGADSVADGGDVVSDTSAASTAGDEEDEIKRKIAELEQESASMTAGQNPSSSSSSSASGDSGGQSAGPPNEIDLRSVYVGNVDYSTTEEELHALFSACGTVNRVTIPVDKFSGTPKGFAYVEFKETESVNNAVLLNGTLFKEREIKVVQKRTNIPGHNRGGRGAPRGRGRGFPRGRGAFQMMAAAQAAAQAAAMAASFNPYFQSRGKFRGRGRGRGGGGAAPY